MVSYVFVFPTWTPSLMVETMRILFVSVDLMFLKKEPCITSVECGFICRLDILLFRRCIKKKHVRPDVLI